MTEVHGDTVVRLLFVGLYLLYYNHGWIKLRMQNCYGVIVDDIFWNNSLYISMEVY